MENTSLSSSRFAAFATTPIRAQLERRFGRDYAAALVAAFVRKQAAGKRCRRMRVQDEVTSCGENQGGFNASCGTKVFTRLGC